MTGLWQVPSVVITLVAWLSAPSSSLVDVARREAVRRQFVGAAQAVVSNATLPAPRPSDIPSAGVDGAGVTEQPAQPAEPVVAAPEVPPADTEQSWRERVSAVRAALEKDEADAARLQATVAGLQRDVTSRDDPAQRAVLSNQLAQAMADRQKAATKAEADRAALAALEEEARRQGVPPGWVR
jgi:hypothetical protein